MILGGLRKVACAALAIPLGITKISHGCGDRRVRSRATQSMIDILQNTRLRGHDGPASVDLRGEPEGISGALGSLLLAFGERTQVPMSLKEVASGRYVWVNAAMSSLLARPTD